MSSFIPHCIPEHHTLPHIQTNAYLTHTRIPNPMLNITQIPTLFNHSITLKRRFPTDLNLPHASSNRNRTMSHTRHRGSTEATSPFPWKGCEYYKLLFTPNAWRERQTSGWTRIMQAKRRWREREDDANEEIDVKRNESAQIKIMKVNVKERWISIYE